MQTQRIWWNGADWVSRKKEKRTPASSGVSRTRQHSCARPALPPSPPPSRWQGKSITNKWGLRCAWTSLGSKKQIPLGVSCLFRGPSCPQTRNTPLQTEHLPLEMVVYTFQSRAELEQGWRCWCPQARRWLLEEITFQHNLEFSFCWQNFSRWPHLLCHGCKMVIKQSFIKHSYKILHNCLGLPDLFRKMLEIHIIGILEWHGTRIFQHRNPSEIFSYCFLDVPVTISVEPKIIKPHSLAETK